jgi:ubiquinol-cytochrome c reductase cytochrome c subunit
MRKMTCFAASLCVAGMGAAAVVLAPATAQSTAPAGNATHGKELFALDGCYECHGYQGQGGGVDGPKLAPDPPPFALIARVLRKPLDRMPVFTRNVLSDSDIADIYAYLQSIPKAKPVEDIPLLRGTPTS